MDIDSFWKIIDKALEKSSGNTDEIYEHTVNALSKLSMPELMEWKLIFDEYYSLSYKNKLWAAAYIICGGCGDDGFDYFRAWLIAQGKEVFLKALKDPDSLADINDIGFPEFEEFLSAPAQAYFKIKNIKEDYDAFYNELGKHSLSENIKQQIASEIVYASDIDAEWDEDDEQQLESMLPRLFIDFEWQDETDDDETPEPADDNERKALKHISANHDYNSKRQYKEAIGECENALKYSPMNPEAHYCIAVNRMNLEEYKEAVKSFDYLIGKNLYNPKKDTGMRAYFRRGQCKNRLEDTEGALEDFQQSIDCETFTADSLCAAGAIYNVEKEYDKAAEVYAKALEYKDSFDQYTPAEAWLGLGLANMGARKYEEAVKSYKQAISFQPDMWSAYNLCGLCLKLLGKIDEGEKMIQIYQNKNTNN